jgi:hypothetical protein
MTNNIDMKQIWGGQSLLCITTYNTPVSKREKKRKKTIIKNSADILGHELDPMILTIC